ncbi:MAG: SpoIIIAH-like family protein [Clostridiales bacterium]|nr:SpoIIIAH-like family protein [Clostridiales bacterium]
MIIKKRQLVIATLVLALGAAIFINWYYSGPRTEVTGLNSEGTAKTDNIKDVNSEDVEMLGDAQYVNSANVSANDYFAEARLKRSAAHDEALEALNDIIKDSASKSEAVKEAQKKLNEIADAFKEEANIETLIKAKIKSDCIAVINDKNAEIIVEKGALNDSTVVLIKEIVLKQTNLSAENVIIIDLNY